MARKRDPNRDKAYEIWKQHNGDITNRAIAERLGIDEKKIAVWKQRDKWNVVQQSDNNVVQQKKQPAKKARSPNKKKPVVEEAEEAELTDKQALFCMHYVKSFNATMAAIKAGYSKDTAHVQGSRLLRNVKVAEYIRELKAELQEDLFISAKDVMNYYVKIAFADITDYVTFERKDVYTGKTVAVLNTDGSVKDMVPGVESYNEMFFKNSDEIDGTIVAEVKQGRDGVGVKLVDKKWALDKLDRYFDLFPDAFKRRIEEEKLKIAQLAAKEDEEDDYEDDGFIDAIDGKTKEVWGDANDPSNDD
jgi:phage terminase small subunit